MPMRVQLEIDPFPRQLPHFLLVHQVQDALSEQLKIVDAQPLGQPGRNLIFLLPRNLQAVGPPHQLLLCRLARWLGTKIHWFLEAKRCSRW